MDPQRLYGNTRDGRLREGSKNKLCLAEQSTKAWLRPIALWAMYGRRQQRLEADLVDD